ncbi:MAG: hypothetical protein JWO45_1368 [Spartobacteria bacterium]|nr:hypothetical protein [Spartobacteria bacterium]
MSEEKKETTHETEKPHVRDLEPEKDPKGGGSFKPQSPTPGGDQTQPVPNQGT